MESVMKSLLTACFSAIAMLTTATAPAATYDLEKPHTQILFKVNHLGFSNSTGRFTDFDGVVEFDPEDWGSASVDVVIQAASVEMNHEKWNAHMKDGDFFDVAEHGQITFKSTQMTRVNKHYGNLKGVLTILGVSKPVELEVKLNKVGTHPFKKQALAGFSASTVIKRSEWGVKYGIPMVGNDVEISIEVEAIQR
ncbi:MAG: polyisoprenoid-binding protein YceI [Gammaproteobacteria bacterium]|jgi:polyisoprenoid-binding protein YceI